MQNECSQSSQIYLSPEKLRFFFTFQSWKFLNDKFKLPTAKKKPVKGHVEDLNFNPLSILAGSVQEQGKSIRKNSNFDNRVCNGAICISKWGKVLVIVNGV